LLYGRLEAMTCHMSTPAIQHSARPSTKGEATRHAILDACEVLFAQNGYLGTSLRDIAAQAGVRMGVVHYHFGNKHLILDAALERKLPLLQGRIAASFELAEAAEGEFGPREIVTAFILPFLTAASCEASPLRNYIVMTSHLMSAYRMPELRPILAKLSVISGMLTERLRIHLPAMAESDLLAAVYLIEAALIFMVQDPGFLDDLTDGHFSARKLEDIAQPALRFFTAGLVSLQA
jgi:AcrR family transcriptional regulator